MKQTNRSYLTTTLILLIALFSVACSSDELTREKAEELIKPLFPIETTGSVFIYTIYSELYNNHYFEGREEKNEVAKTRGLIIGQTNNVSGKFHKHFNQSAFKWEKYPLYLYQESFTSKGQEYVLSEGRNQRGTSVKVDGKKYYNNQTIYTIKCGQFDFTEISGLFIKNENEVEIEYKVTYNETPFGYIKRWGYMMKSYSDGQIDTRKAIAKKFDDGWRLVD